MRALLVCSGLLVGLLAVPSALADPVDDSCDQQDACADAYDCGVYYHTLCIDICAAQHCENWEVYCYTNPVLDTVCKLVEQ